MSSESKKKKTRVGGGNKKFALLDTRVFTYFGALLSKKLIRCDQTTKPKC
jgi:hypothetical protein